jgi:hypothetical protein
MNSGNRQLLNPDRHLRAGCYYFHFEPTYPYWGENDPPQDREREVREYAGTMRVVHYNNEGTVALTPTETKNGKVGLVVNISGDLYAMPPSYQVPDGDQIPIFPIGEYRFYLLANKIEEGEKGEFILYLESYEFSSAAGSQPCPIEARLKWSAAPAASISAFDYLEGSVFAEDGSKIGEMSLKWISDYLRRAILEIDRVNDVRTPSDNYSGLEEELVKGLEQTTWAKVFERGGWLMKAENSDQPAEPATKTWRESELHRALPELRDSFDVDREWRYQMFCVGTVEDGGRGYEFDAEGGPKNSGLFASVVLAAKYEFSRSETETDAANLPWGAALGGRTLDETPAYFRTAVHELGHALNLEHNFSTAGFMATTDAIREIAERRRTQINGEKGGKEDPNGEIDVLKEIEWQFAPDDLERLRHWPDVVVRPGAKRPKFVLPGIDTFRFDALFGGAAEDAAETNLQFEIKPYRESVPLGAPVRILTELWNIGETPLKVPKLRLKAGNIYGQVESRSKQVRTFQALSGPDDELGMETLEKRTSVKGSLTLLGGPEGALFPGPGSYKVTVCLQVYRRGGYIELKKSTEVRVEPYIDDKQRRVAELLLNSGPALVNFVIGDGLAEGEQAINLALNNPILGPHYAVVSLKRLCRAVGMIGGSLDTALIVLAKGQPVLTRPEIHDGLNKGQTPEELRERREPVLTDTEMAGLVNTVRSSLGLSATEEKRVLEEDRHPLDMPNALVLDLQYIGTRIVLGKLQKDTLMFFLEAIENGILKREGKNQTQNLNTSRAKELFQELLSKKVGLSDTASYQLTQLLMARDNNVFKAIQSYNQGDDKSEETKKVQQALEELGLSTDDLNRIIRRLAGVAGPNLQKLQKLLVAAGSRILEKVEEVGIDDKLGKQFRKNLVDNLFELDLLRSSDVPGSAEGEVVSVE